MAASPQRSPEEVFHDHLKLRKAGRIEEDLRRNYADDVIVLSSFGRHRGREAVRRLAELLEEQMPGAHFEYRNTLVEGELAFLEWTAWCDGGFVEDGADSFCIRNGVIVGKTVHYTVKSPPEGSRQSKSFHETSARARHD